MRTIDLALILGIAASPLVVSGSDPGDAPVHSIESNAEDWPLRAPLIFCFFAPTSSPSLSSFCAERSEQAAYTPLDCDCVSAVLKSGGLRLRADVTYDAIDAALYLPLNDARLTPNARRAALEAGEMLRSACTIRDADDKTPIAMTASFSPTER